MHDDVNAFDCPSDALGILQRARDAMEPLLLQRLPMAARADEHARVRGSAGHGFNDVRAYETGNTGKKKRWDRHRRL
jgi:hypothetical protein